MKLYPVRTGRRAIPSVLSLITLLLTLNTGALRAFAQDQPVAPKPDTTVYQTLYLTNAAGSSEARDIVTDLRNMLPSCKIYVVESQNAISIRGSVEEIQTAQKILADIDRPRKVYRLTYTLDQMDGDKSVGTQKISMIAFGTGDKALLKQGSKIPIITGTTENGSSAQSSQVQYEDIGLMIEASVNDSPDGPRLRTKIDQSSLADARFGVGTPDPAIEQTVLESMAVLAPGKPLVLGSFDIPGSTHREEVSVVSELVR